MMSALRQTVVVALAATCIGQAGPARSEAPELAPSWIAESPLEVSNWGYSATGIGDIDGDGFPDIAIGAPGWYTHSPCCEANGRVTVYRGSAMGLAPTPYWSRFGTPDSWDSYGGGVAGADVDGDGFSDLIFSGGGVGTQRLFAHHGSPDGPANTEDWSWDVPPDSYGTTPVVASAGDVNGDGYEDIVAGSYRFGSNRGLAVVIHGSPSGLGEAPAWTAQGDTNQRLGYWVAGAGDVNVDGYDDVFVGRWELSAALYYGSATGLGEEPGRVFPNAFSGDGAGDVNGDGHDDIVIGDVYYSNGESGEGQALIFFGSTSGPSTTPDWQYEPDLPSVGFGYRVSGAGDFDRDGYGDVIVGAWGYPGDPPFEDEGAAFLFLGSPSGPGAAPVRMTTDHVVDSSYTKSVSEAGDVNGDGYADFLVGAPAALYGWTERVFVYQGMPSSEPGAAGSVDAVGGPGSQPLIVEKAEGGAIELRWSVSCRVSDADYEVYEGQLGDFTSHVPRICGTGAARSFTLVPAETDTYYLVVPRSADREGSYGRDHAGDERPQGAAACLPQEIAACF